MSTSKMPVAFTLLLLASSCVQAVVFNNDFCKTQCTSSSDFIELLPVEEGPVETAFNRPYAWSIVALIQLMFNMEELSPPAAGRITGLVGQCLYEAAALNTKRYKSSTGFSFSLPGAGDEDTLTNTFDGAGFWAVRAVFKSRDTFPIAVEQFEKFSGETIDGLVPKIEFALSLPSPYELKAFIAQLDDRSAAFVVGAVACESVVEKFTEDTFNPDGTTIDGEDPTGYEPFNLPQTLAGITDCDAEILDLSRWQELCVPEEDAAFGTKKCEQQTFLFPWAGRYTTFALEEGDETTGDTLVIPPPALGSAQLLEETETLIRFSAELEDVGKIIAEYWADGPDFTSPAGHYWKIAGDAAILEKLDSLETARLLFIVGNAMNDGGIASWRTKTTFDLVRPLQLIQCGPFRGEIQLAWQGPYMGVGMMNLSEFRPFMAPDFISPPFAAYTSGHSTISAAAAEALRLFFGDDKYRGPSCYLSEKGTSFYEPESDEIPGVTDIPNTGSQSIGFSPATDVVLCWDTWLDSALESGESRFFGGVHIPADDAAGQSAGLAAGAGVFNKAQSLLCEYGDCHDPAPAPRRVKVPFKVHGKGHFKGPFKVHGKGHGKGSAKASARVSSSSTGGSKHGHTFLTGDYY